MSTISHKYKKDYKTPDYRNPRLLRSEEQKQRRQRLCAVVLCVLIMVGLIYVLFFSRYTQISTVQITGVEKINLENLHSLISEELRGRRYLIFPTANIVFFSEEGLLKKISEAYWLENLQIQKRFPHTLLVNIQEKQAWAVFLANNQCYQVDKGGALIGYCEEQNPTLVIKLEVPQKEYLIRDDVLPVELVEQFAALHNNLQELGFNDIRQYTINQDDNLTLISNAGPVIRFNLRDSLSEQASRLMLLLEDGNVRSKLKELEYIDLRFGDKVYYK